MTKNGGHQIRSLAFLLLATTAASGNAQTPSSAGPLRLTETLRALRDSQMVRTVAVGVGRSQGRVLEHSDTLLVLRREGELLRLPSTSIDSLWIRGNSLKKGLAWGAGVGGLGGLAVGLLIDQTLCEYGCDEAIPVMGLLGAGAGTAVGAIVGAVIPKWQRRWPHSPPRSWNGLR